MLDREVVAAIVAGDPAGLATAYDRYAAALHSYCCGILREPADAADAVQDTFVIAAGKLSGLRDPDLLRPWLYAVARNECRRRLRSRSASVELDAADEMSDGSAPVGEEIERGQLRELVHQALAGLNPGDREVLELSLQHDLAPDELALTLGVALNHVHALLSRARVQLERSLGALLVARSGRESCPELAAILSGWDGRLDVLLRKRVNRHIENCDVCGERRRFELAPARLLGLLPVVVLPPELRSQVLHLITDQSQAAAAHRARVLKQAEPFDLAGFPRPLALPGDGDGSGGGGGGGNGGRRRRRAVAAAGLGLLIIVAASTAATLTLWHPVSSPAAAPGPSTTSLVSSSPTLVAEIGSADPTTASASPSPSSSPSPSPSAALTTAAAIVTKPTAKPTPTPSQSTTPQIPQCETANLAAQITNAARATDTISAFLVLTNQANQACTVIGYPGMLQQNVDHTAITTTVVRVASTKAQLVTIPAGGSATATLQWSDVPAAGEIASPDGNPVVPNAVRVCEPTGMYLEVTPPNNTTQLVITFGYSVCNYGTIDTTVFIPGTQGPAM